MATQEIREIYQQKGFESELLDKVVTVITSHRDRWVNVMMKEELGMVEESKSPIWIGTVTYFSFLLIVTIPLLVYVIDCIHPLQSNQSMIASILTALGFTVIGWMKTIVNKTSVFKGVFETLILGSVAAIMAYFVGDTLEQIITS